MFRWLCLALAATAALAADDLAALSDEFDSPDTLQQWTIRDQAERGPATFALLDIAKTTAGHLTIVPRPQRAWYRDGMGPFIHKLVQGDFLATCHVVAHSRRRADVPPGGDFDSGGILARDPASGRGRQNWVVVNVGRQNGATGSEVKTTVNSGSQLWTAPGPPVGEVRIGRLGAAFHMLRRLQGEREWRELTVFNRPDLPAELQVGLMTNGWTQGTDVQVEIDYIRFARPTGPDDLTRDIPAAEG